MKVCPYVSKCVNHNDRTMFFCLNNLQSKGKRRQSPSDHAQLSAPSQDDRWPFKIIETKYSQVALPKSADLLNVKRTILLNLITVKIFRYTSAAK